MSMIKPATQNERLQTVLENLGVSTDLSDDPKDALGELADAIADSDYAVLCDWRLTNIAVLMELIAHLSTANIDLDEDDDDCVLTVGQDDGSEVSTRFDNVNAAPRDQVVVRFLRLLPHPPTVWKVRAYEETDTDLYVVLDDARAESIRQVLAAQFPAVFRELTTS